MEYYAVIENVDGGLHEQGYYIIDDINRGLSPPITESMRQWLKKKTNITEHIGL